MSQRRSERIEVYFEDGPVYVQQVGAATSYDVGAGVTVREEFYGGVARSANFRLTVFKEVFAVEDVHPTYELLRETLESFRIIWPMAGGTRVERPFVTNHEIVYKELLAERGQHPVSVDFTCPISAASTYRNMPLKNAVSMLRGLGKLPEVKCLGRVQEILWLCVEWYEMASAARDPLDKFMKAFPPIDLLASKHHDETYTRTAQVEAILAKIREGICANRDALGDRVTEVLFSNLKECGLRDKFQAFVDQRYPGRSAELIEEFAELNKARNDLFHEADYQAISAERAENARRLLYECLLSELATPSSS